MHLDDAIVTFEGEGLRRHLCPMGQGVVDWLSILSLLPDVPRYIDLHRGQFVTAIRHPKLRCGAPDLAVAELAAVIGMAARRGADALVCQGVTQTRLDSMLAPFAVDRRVIGTPRGPAV